MPERYWIAVVSREHVLTGVAGSFAQAGHGKSATLKRMKQGDWLIYYSPKMSLRSNEKCQRFTAIGRVIDDRIYQVEMSKDFIPNRRDVEYKKCEEISILPLIEQLSFIDDKKHWGYKFKFGILEIPKSDFDLISSLMIKE